VNGRSSLGSNEATKAEPRTVRASGEERSRNRATRGERGS